MLEGKDCKQRRLALIWFIVGYHYVHDSKQCMPVMLLVISECVSIIAVPLPMVTLTQSRKGEEQLAGRRLILTANISIERSIVRPDIISTSWTVDGKNLSSNGRITVTSMTAVPGTNHYQTQVIFNSLSSALDSGTYAFVIEVNGDLVYLLSTPPTIHAETSITVTGNHMQIT